MAKPSRQRLLELADNLGGALLAIETSGPQTSLCAVGFCPGEVVERTLVGRAMPSEAISLAVATELARSGLQAERLRALVIGLGPGSFTGLRAVLAFVKGLAFAANIPVIGVSSLAVLAGSAGVGTIAVARDARRGAIFGAMYQIGDTAVNAIEADGLFAPDDFVRRVLGHGRASVLWVTDDARVETTASLLRQPVVALREMRVAVAFTVAADELSARRFSDLDALTPRYLRSSEAERNA
jgi:tRNA threonylcarbamoyladenosine biosynthesis protein TsaB